MTENLVKKLSNSLNKNTSGTRTSHRGDEIIYKQYVQEKV